MGPNMEIGKDFVFSVLQFNYVSYVELTIEVSMRFMLVCEPA